MKEAGSPKPPPTHPPPGPDPALPLGLALASTPGVALTSVVLFSRFSSVPPCPARHRVGAPYWFGLLSLLPLP